MKRSLPPRTKPMARSRIARRKRPASAQREKHEREYGSAEREAWLRGKPCVVCGRGPVELHHTKNGGLGKKGPASSLVPLCLKHHREFHDTGMVVMRTAAPASAPWSAMYFTKIWFRNKAAELEAAFRAVQGEQKASA